METCNLCKKPLSETKFVYHNVPVYNTNVECMCDECAGIFLRAFMEENSPEFSRESASNYPAYQEAMKLLDNIYKKEN